VERLLRAKWTGNNIAIALICFIVGFTFTMQIKSVMENSKKDYSTSQERIDSLTTQLSESQKENEGLIKELGDYRLTAGATDVTGEGIEITLYDLTDASLSPEETLVHQQDILMVVNELRNAGAEAISVNDIRFTATSYVRCVGSVIDVDGTRFSAPYTIKAIGGKNNLEKAMKQPGGIVAFLTADGKRIDIAKKDNLELPMNKKPLVFNYMKEATK